MEPGLSQATRGQPVMTRPRFLIEASFELYVGTSPEIFFSFEKKFFLSLKVEAEEFFFSQRKLKIRSGARLEQFDNMRIS